MEVSQRKQQILTAVDRLIAVEEQWAADPSAPPYVTSDFEDAVAAVDSAIASGDIPEICLGIVTAIGRLMEEWNQYAIDEQMDANGAPLPRFWGAFRHLIEERNSIVRASKNPPLEPVGRLLDEKVSFHQIAFHIYGHQGKGPFIGPDGQPDVAKILQEGDTPGSVIPAGWVHPSRQRSGDRMVRINRSQERMRRREEDDVPSPKEKASVESLLRDGQFVGAIARVKGLQESEVRAIAASLGLPAIDKPSLLVSDDLPQTEKDQPKTRRRESRPESRPDTAHSDPSEVNAQILALAGTMPHGEIAAKCQVSPQKVTAVLRSAQLRQKAAEPAA